MKVETDLPAGIPEPEVPFWRRFLGLPRTRAGKWSLGLLAGCLLAFFLMQLLVVSGQRGGDTFLDNLWLSLPALAGLLCALAAGAMAAVAVIRHGERSLFAFLALLLGLLLLVFLVGEIATPH